jgi:hypothetical protein
MGESRYLIFCVETDASAICEKFHKRHISTQKSGHDPACAVVGDAVGFHSISCTPLPFDGRGVFLNRPMRGCKGKSVSPGQRFFPRHFRGKKCSAFLRTICIDRTCLRLPAGLFTKRPCHAGHTPILEGSRPREKENMETGGSQSTRIFDSEQTESF